MSTLHDTPGPRSWLYHLRSRPGKAGVHGWVKLRSNSLSKAASRDPDQVGWKDVEQPGPMGVYVPRIYGFRVHESAPGGPCMQWLRMRREDVGKGLERRRFDRTSSNLSDTTL